MTLHVFSARISSRDPDRLDVTRRAIDVARKRGAPEPPGAFLAPSWGILQPAMEARTRANETSRREQAAFNDLMNRARAAEDDAEGIRLATQAREMLDASWTTYVDGYIAEMRVSYSQCVACAANLTDGHTCPENADRWGCPIAGWPQSWKLAYARGTRSRRPQWDGLLTRPRLVLLCYCTDAEHCHRYLLRTRILPALGAIDCGEILEAAA